MGIILDSRKKKGKIDEGLATSDRDDHGLDGTVGIGHTRWATHGPPSDENSHPHLDASGRIAVVHNGVIENYERLKERLASRRATPSQSATDTEVLAHLIGEHYEGSSRRQCGEASSDATMLGAAPLARLMSALREVIGAYGIAVICADFPGVIIGARRGSPLIVGVGDGENFLASDANAIAPHTRQVVYLNDYDVVTLTPGQISA